MRSIFILTILLSATNFGVFSVPIPVKEGDIAGFRGEKSKEVKKPTVHPVVVVGPETDGQQAILEASHDLPKDKYPHQEDIAKMGLGPQLGEGGISTLPSIVNADKLKPWVEKGSGHPLEVPSHVYDNLKAQMAQCEGGTCNHVPKQEEKEEGKGKQKEKKEPVQEKVQAKEKVEEKQKAPVIPEKPQVPLQQPPKDNKPNWANIAASPAKVAAPVGKPPAQVGKPPAQVVKPQGQVVKPAADQKKIEKRYVRIDN